MQQEVRKWLEAGKSRDRLYYGVLRHAYIYIYIRMLRCEGVRYLIDYISKSVRGTHLVCCMEIKAISIHAHGYII